MNTSLNQLPQEVCNECRAEAPDHWLAGLWWYCPHKLIMCTWDRKNSTWRIDRKVKPKKAMKHLATAMAKMQGYAEKQGVSMKEADSMLTWLRKFDRDK